MQHRRAHRELGRGLAHHDDGVADARLRVAHPAVGCRAAMQLLRAERVSDELQEPRHAVHDEIGRDGVVIGRPVVRGRHGAPPTRG